MVVMAEQLVIGRDWTRADLDALRDDGHRYEIIDGVLIATPSHSLPHQDVVLSLAVLLRAGCPAHLKTMIAPFDVVLDEATVLEPDVLVCVRSELGFRALNGPPVLAVEVLSRTTARRVRGRKMDRLQRAGCPHYWLVDPIEPALTAYELVDGRYRQVAHVTADEAWEVARPFPVTVVPADLLD